MGFAVVRYNTNGTLDKTFNKTGIVKTNFSTNNEEIRAMVVQPNGSIVVAGQSSNSTNTVILARYTTSGALDTTFGSGGTFIDPIPTINGHSVSWLEVTAIALQSDGYIIVGAEAALANQPIQMLLIAYTPSDVVAPNDPCRSTAGVVEYRHLNSPGGRVPDPGHLFRRRITPGWREGRSPNSFLEIPRRSGAAIEIALAEIKAHLPAGFVLAGRFHALGHRSDAEVVDHLYERGQDLLMLWRGGVDVANERHVELHVVRGHFG